MKFLIGNIAMLAVLAACSTSPQTSPSRQLPDVIPGPGLTEDQESLPRVDDSVTVLAPTLIGLTEEEAKKLLHDEGIDWRIGYRDGETFSLTLDFNPKRITVSIDNGIITAVATG